MPFRFGGDAVHVYLTINIMGLEWEPGVMQVDFGRALAVIGGERTGVHCLVVTFPYSNMRYVCFASMFVRQVRQCFSAVWADGFPRCRHRFPVM